MCIIYIYCDDVYKWVRDNKGHFDLSEDKYNPDNENKKVLGKFKDELNGVVMKNFTALNPKVYCFKTVEDNETVEDDETVEDSGTRKAKGVSKVVLKKDIKNSDYDHVLNTEENVNRSVVSIRSIAHKVYTIKTNKTCLTPWYDKFKVIDNNNCEPVGYKPKVIKSED